MELAIGFVEFALYWVFLYVVLFSPKVIPWDFLIKVNSRMEQK